MGGRGNSAWGLLASKFHMRYIQNRNPSILFLGVERPARASTRIAFLECGECSVPILVQYWTEPHGGDSEVILHGLKLPYRYILYSSL